MELTKSSNEMSDKQEGAPESAKHKGTVSTDRPQVSTFAYMLSMISWLILQRPRADREARTSKTRASDLRRSLRAVDRSYCQYHSRIGQYRVRVGGNLCIIMHLVYIKYFEPFLNLRKICEDNLRSL